MDQPFQPRDPNFRQRISSSFEQQQVMQTLHAELCSVEPGIVRIELPYQASLTQQHGFLHAGIITTIIDSACGYAAFSLMPADAEVLSVEFKINLMAPAKGERLIAIGKVIKPGRTLTVVHGDAYMLIDGKQKPVTHMVGTMMCLRGREDLSQA